MANRDVGFTGAARWLVALLLASASACSAQVQADTKTPGGAEPEAAPSEGSDDSTDPAEPSEATSSPALLDSGPPGTITFVYRRRQITACAMQDEEGEKVCAAKTDQEHRGAAEIVLTPVDENDEEDPTRAERVVSFEDGQAEQTREVELGKGRWELEWKGESTARDRFKVVSKDRFEITLEGIAGMCSMQGKKCALEPQKNQQVIELPEARGLH
jgi:hypothetical protein